jgi:putative FmdB family regulatory protein
MPTYSYRCPKCAHEYDRLQKISDTSRARCPECGARGERQITGGAGILFKGSGFYITDYKRAGEKKSDVAESADGKPTDKKAAEGSSTSKSKDGADS